MSDFKKYAVSGGFACPERAREAERNGLLPGATKRAKLNTAAHGRLYPGPAP
jgi:hypothetical protein